MSWKKISKEECLVLSKEHKDNLTVFASYTDVDGNGYVWSSGHPEIMTEWGLSGEENPIYKVLMTKEHRFDEKWTYEYFLFYEKT